MRSANEYYEMGWNDATGYLANFWPSAVKEREEGRAFLRAITAGPNAEVRDNPDYLQGVHDAADSSPLTYKGPDWIVAAMEELRPLPELNTVD